MYGSRKNELFFHLSFKWGAMKTSERAVFRGGFIGARDADACNPTAATIHEVLEAEREEKRLRQGWGTPRS